MTASTTAGAAKPLRGQPQARSRSLVQGKFIEPLGLVGHPLDHLRDAPMPSRRELGCHDPYCQGKVILVVYCRPASPPSPGGCRAARRSIPSSRPSRFTARTCSGRGDSSRSSQAGQRSRSSEADGYSTAGTPSSPSVTGVALVTEHRDLAETRAAQIRPPDFRQVPGFRDHRRPRRGWAPAVPARAAPAGSAISPAPDCLRWGSSERMARLPAGTGAP
jgi:hypothetical protein